MKERVRLPERLADDRVELRRWRIPDAEVLARAVAESAEHLRPWMPWIAQEPMSLAERREMLGRWEREWSEGGDAALGVFYEGAAVGSCGLHHRVGPGGLEIGYWIHPQFTLRGFATAAGRLLTDGALSVPGITRVEIHHDKANVASGGVPRKLGYVLVGEVEDGPEAPAEIGVECIWRMERDRWLRSAQS